MPEKSWVKSKGEEIVVGLLICSIWAVFGYLFGKQNPLARPLFYGFVASALLLIAYLMFRLTRRIPKAKIVPTLNNIEGCVHSWLDNHRVSVKKDPSPTSHFRFRITMNDKTMTIVRMREESSEYVQILADLGTHGDNKELEQFNNDELEQIMWNIRVELARAQVGYSGLVNPPENFIIFRNVPIHHNLTEFAFMSTVGSVEAAMNLVALMLVKAKSDVDRRKQSNAPPKPQLASDIQKLEPPVV